MRTTSGKRFAMRPIPMTALMAADLVLPCAIKSNFSTIEGMIGSKKASSAVAQISEQAQARFVRTRSSWMFEHCIANSRYFAACSAGIVLI
eukprot:m.112090 g.112090  ORF g.112090 m.112090 type:complete len:91 (+) comp22811_c0_seq1:166-438(+)